MREQERQYPLTIVTGAGGWLGKRVVAAIVAPQNGGGPPKGRLRCLARPDEPGRDLQEVGAELVCGDLRDSECVSALFANAAGALVIHLAGVIHPARVRDFDEINHRGTLSLLAAAKRARATRFVAMSSNSPLGANQTNDGVFTEDSPYNPYMGYGRSKYLMELGLRAAIDDAGVPEVVILRAPWFYGPGQPTRQTRFFTMIKDGRFPIMGAGENRRSMAYVDSLAQAVTLCGSVSAAAGRTYWIADERAYSMREIVSTVKAVLREDFGIKVVAKDLTIPSFAGDLARIADRGLQALGVYNQNIHVLSEMNLTIACDIARAKAELGYQPLVELREGMRRSVEWCIAKGLKL